MSTLADIEIAISSLSVEELAELERFVREQRGKKTGTANAASGNLWSGARERLRELLGERTLSEKEVAKLRVDGWS